MAALVTVSTTSQVRTPALRSGSLRSPLLAVSSRYGSTCPLTQRVTLQSRKSFNLGRVRAVAPKKAELITEARWEEAVLKSETPVLVDFWAPWCGPCRVVAPILDELAAEYGDRLNIRKLNTDESPKIATEHGIQSIPTLILFKQGKRVESIIGAVPKTTLKQVLDKHI